MINPLSQNLNPEDKKNILEFFPEGLIALDLETTGLSPLTDRIIEISGVKITKDSESVFQTLINPEIPIPFYTTKIHGITDDMVKNAPKMQTVMPEFLNFVMTLPLVAHNAQFDMGFLIYNMNKDNFKVPACEVYCSCKLSRKVFPNMPNHKLGTLAENLKIGLARHHRAQDDAMAGLLIFAKELATIVSDKSKIKDALIYNLESFGAEKKMTIPERLEVLRQKMAGQEEVEIKYSGGSFKNEWRPVKPVSFLPTPQGNVLYAFCLKSNLYKSFYLDKIIEAKAK